MAFEGFTAETVSWFDGLAVDNSRAYFQATRDSYERVARGPMTALLTDLAAEFGGTVKLFRPNRDVRFSADKSPYKTNTSGLLVDRPGTAALVYVSVSAEGLFAATGYYQMAKDQLARYRQALNVYEDAVEQGQALRTILNALAAKGWEIGDAPTKGLPRGVAKDSPNADLLRRKGLTVSGNLDEEAMCDADAARGVGRAPVARCRPAERLARPRGGRKYAAAGSAGASIATARRVTGALIRRRQAGEQA